MLLSLNICQYLKSGHVEKVRKNDIKCSTSSQETKHWEFGYSCRMSGRSKSLFSYCQTMKKKSQSAPLDFRSNCKWVGLVSVGQYSSLLFWLWHRSSTAPVCLVWITGVLNVKKNVCCGAICRMMKNFSLISRYHICQDIKANKYPWF